MRDGLFEAILDKFYEDPTMIAYGEDNRDWGGALCGIPRPDGGAAVPSFLQRTHFRIGYCRFGSRLCHVRRPGGR